MKFFKENVLYCLFVLAYIVYTSYFFIDLITTGFESDASGSIDRIFMKLPNVTLTLIYLIVFILLAYIKKDKHKLYKVTSKILLVLIVLWFFC